MWNHMFSHRRESRNIWFCPGYKLDRTLSIDCRDLRALDLCLCHSLIVCIRVVTCPDDGATIINPEHVFHNYRKGKYRVGDIAPRGVRPYGRSVLVVDCVILESLSTVFAAIAIDAEANRWTLLIERNLAGARGCWCAVGVSDEAAVVQIWRSATLIEDLIAWRVVKTPISPKIDISIASWSARIQLTSGRRLETILASINESGKNNRSIIRLGRIGRDIYMCGHS